MALGTDIAALFQESYLNGRKLTHNLILFNTLDYLQTFLEDNPHHIGYLLRSQMPKEVQILNITGSDSISSQYYVLAVTKQAPEGELKQFLLCLQDSK